MSNYGFSFQGRVYIPDGLLPGLLEDHVQDHNKEVEGKEIAWLKTAPDRVFLYIHELPVELIRKSAARIWIRCEVTTWLGMVLDGNAMMGPPIKVPAYYHPSTRRSVTARIFGVLYHGTYYESSGNYCRLKKAKRQS